MRVLLLLCRQHSISSMISTYWCELDAIIVRAIVRTQDFVLSPRWDLLFYAAEWHQMNLLFIFPSYFCCAGVLYHNRIFRVQLHVVALVLVFLRLVKCSVAVLDLSMVLKRRQLHDSVQNFTGDSNFIIVDELHCSGGDGRNLENFWSSLSWYEQWKCYFTVIYRSDILPSILTQLVKITIQFKTALLM